MRLASFQPFTATQIAVSAVILSVLTAVGTASQAPRTAPATQPAPAARGGPPPAQPGASAGPLTVRAQVAANVKPAWAKGIVPITSESYYNAIECGKQGGANPPCVFWDTGLCKNPDFELAFFPGYKSVAYEVWRLVSQKQPAPTPNYAQAQQTRVTIGVTPVRGSTNAFSDFTLLRAGKPVIPVSRSPASGGGRFTFDYPAFAPSADVRLDIAGKTRTISCTVDRATLARMR